MEPDRREGASGLGGLGIAAVAVGIGLLILAIVLLLELSSATTAAATRQHSTALSLALEYLAAPVLGVFSGPTASPAALITALRVTLWGLVGLGLLLVVGGVRLLARRR